MDLEMTGCDTSVNLYARPCSEHIYYLAGIERL